MEIPRKQADARYHRRKSNDNYMDERGGRVGIAINVVNKKASWRSLGSGEITIDSALEASVCPKGWGGACELGQPEKWLKFTTPICAGMGHCEAKGPRRPRSKPRRRRPS